MNATKRQPEQPPKPGAYPNTSFAEYASWSAVNNSLLRKAALSAAHARAWLDSEADDDTESLYFGRMLHFAVLEPAYFDAHVQLEPSINRKSSKERDELAAMKARDPDALWVTQEQAVAIDGMRRSIRESELARKMSGTPGARECSIVWDSGGVRCKARVDKVCPDARILVDLKTTRSARPEDFERSALDYGYFEQAAHYTEGAAAVWPGEPWQYGIIAVEKEPPYAVTVFIVDPVGIEFGARRNAVAWQTLRKAMETNAWPSYSTRVEPLTPPTWAMRQAGMS